MDGAPADAATVRSLLGELAGLEAQGFPDDTTEAAAPDEPEGGEPDRIVTVRGADGGERLVVRMWEPGEGGGANLEATAAGPAAHQPDTRFQLPTWRGDRLTPEIDAARGGDAGEG